LTGSNTILAPDALVIGGGPAGLMASEEMARSDLEVLVIDAKPSFGRKFLMAGKSGLNLTKSESPEKFHAQFKAARPALQPMLEAFGPPQVEAWAKGLGQTLFTGTTGRVFPTVMKASPLLRSWLERLDALGVTRKTRWHWTGWQAGSLQFDTPQGRISLRPKATVLALGGASWARLGSDGKWVDHLRNQGILLAPFQPANTGLLVDWSPQMACHFGKPLKSIAFHTGTKISRGEAMISATGLEGGGVYPLCPDLRQGFPLHIDLCPDLKHTQVAQRVKRPRDKASWSNHLRKQLRLDKPKLALISEFHHHLTQDSVSLAQLIKRLKIPYRGLSPIDQAISVSGGIPFEALDDGLMLRFLPGVFCAGEMLDWEAPTGGYLLTGCFATGRWAGRSAVNYVGCL
jgi:uncharacterized flavoprotein (TIGR03862 family)